MSPFPCNVLVQRSSRRATLWSLGWRQGAAALMSQKTRAHVGERAVLRGFVSTKCVLEQVVFRLGCFSFIVCIVCATLLLHHLISKRHPVGSLFTNERECPVLRLTCGIKDPGHSEFCPWISCRRCEAWGFVGQSRASLAGQVRCLAPRCMSPSLISEACLSW